MTGRVLIMAGLVSIPGALTGGRLARVFIVTVLLLLVGEAVVARLRLNRATFSLDLPPALTAGITTEVGATFGGPPGLLVAAHAIEGVISEMVICRAPSEGSFPIVAPARGLVERARIRLVGGDVLGLMAAQADHVIELADPVPVAPEPLADPDLARAVEVLVMAGVDEELVGVRPYQPGDRPAEVHWPSVARAGEVLVRERRADQTGRRPITIVAGSASPDHLETVLAMARWAVERVWSLGGVAALVTVDHGGDGGARSIPVAGPLELARQLAVAVPGPCSVESTGGPMIWIDEGGVRWTTPA